MKKAQLKDILLALTVIYFGTIIGLGINHTQNVLDPGSTQQPAPQTPETARKLPLPLPVGTAAPNFKLADLAGKPHSLNEYRSKKMVLIEFFASWCSHCQHTVPSLNKLQSQYAHYVSVLAINAGDGQNESTASSFASTYKTRYTILDNPPEALLQSYKLSGIPLLYLVDRNGKIVWSHMGQLHEPELNTLEKLIKP